MSVEEQNPNQRDRFALAMAMGQSVSAWARKNGVPTQTCFDWTRTQEHKSAVQDVRRRAIDRAAGQLVHDLTKAVGRIGRLATRGKTEYVQLQAARAVLKEMIVVREHFDLEEQMSEIERDIEANKTEFP